MILMYHHVAEPAEVPPASQQDPAEGWSLTVSPGDLRRHLRALRARGYRVVPLAEIVAAIRADGVEPETAVAVSFDDGWVDVYRNALPVLRELDCAATFFVNSEHLRPGGSDARRMDAAQLRDLVAHGMDVGGHTRSHADLTRLAPEAAWEEIAGCKRDLEQVLGRALAHFAYPGGAFDRRVAAQVRDAGWEAACSVLGPARNDRSSLFWLYRDVLTPSLRSLGDRYRLSRLARRALAFRVRRRLRAQLEESA